MGQADQVTGDAAHQQLRQCAVPLGTGDDQVDVVFELQPAQPAPAPAAPAKQPDAAQ